MEEDKIKKGAFTRNVVPNSKRGTHIFVVDDDLEFLELASELLRIEGYRTSKFSNPSAALQAFKERPDRPQLLVTDVKMEPFGGPELAAYCREIDPHLQVILISGFVLEPQTPDHHGVDGFLSKPFLARTYLTAVADILAGKTLALAN